MDSTFHTVPINNDHTYRSTKRDTGGVLSFVADGAYLLFHNSFFPDISLALDDFRRQNHHRVIDFGTLTREVTLQEVSAGDAVIQIRTQA